MARDLIIRLARPDERGLLRDVEVASGRLFLDVGMPEIAADEPMWLDGWPVLVATGLVWVAELDGAVVGFAMCEVVDGNVHLEQLSVHPDHGRQGIGAALVEHVCAEAARRSANAVTLSTFRDVPFNGPYYERLGFVSVAERELTPGLAARRDHETAAGLDPTTRVMMRRAV